MGCSRGVPGLFRAVPGCSGGVLGYSGRVPGCPGVFRGVLGFTDTPLYAKATEGFRVRGGHLSKIRCSGVPNSWPMKSFLMTL